MRMTLPVLVLSILVAQGAMAAGDGTAAVGGGVGGALGNIVGQQLADPQGPPSGLGSVVLPVARSVLQEAAKPKQPLAAVSDRPAAQSSVTG